MSDPQPTTDGATRPDRTATAAASSESAPPGPRGLPAIGSTLSFARDPLGFVDGLDSYGDFVRYEAFGREFRVVFDPAVVETVLVARDDAFWRGEFEHEFGDAIDVEGVFFSEGERWRQQRLLLQRAFTPDRIASYADDMVEATVRVVDEWSDGQIVDVRDAFSALTLDVLTRSLFDLGEARRASGPRSGAEQRSADSHAALPRDDGDQPRGLEGDCADRVRRWVAALGDYIDREAFGVRSLLPEWVPSAAKREYARATADVEALVEDLVAERRRADADGDDLLTLLATGTYPDGSRPSPDEISDQLMLFLLAGHETTATALTYACWLLAGTDDAREALAREVETVCGDRDPTIGDLPDLSVAEAVGREAMRLYPPLPFLQREAHEPIEIEGYRLEPGTTVQLATYSIHRDGRWWDEPDSFRPDRWLGADDRSVVADPADRPSYAYFPFGGGSRHCIGMRFAMTELQLTLATLAHRVDFERVTTALEPTMRVSLDPGPVELRVRKR